MWPETGGLLNVHANDRRQLSLKQNENTLLPQWDAEK